MMDEKARTYKILVIEDNTNVSSLLQTSLVSRGHQVTIIDDGQKAFNLLETLNCNDFNIILLDIELPNVSGWEILARIRSLESIGQTPVIILTGLDDDFSESRALYDGADDFISKPFSIKVLLARIEANVRKKSTKTINNIHLPFFDGHYEKLSEREIEVLGYLVKGFSTKDISEKAFISENTVMNHIKSIIKKFKVENRMQAVIVAIKYNLV